MNENIICKLLSLRHAVYILGCKTGLWADLESNKTKEFMQYLFPKSGTLAYYNLMLEIVRKKHNEHVLPEYYYLFKFPTQVEEEALNYLKEHDLPDRTADAEQWMGEMATIVCDTQFAPVYIGSLKDMKPETLLNLMAVHYRNLFANCTECYPYFN